MDISTSLIRIDQSVNDIMYLECNRIFISATFFSVYMEKSFAILHNGITYPRIHTSINDSSHNNLAAKSGDSPGRRLIHVNTRKKIYKQVRSSFPSFVSITAPGPPFAREEGSQPYTLIFSFLAIL